MKGETTAEQYLKGRYIEDLKNIYDFWVPENQQIFRETVGVLD